MSGGLLALLDDVAAIAKVAAASLDDVAAQTIKAGSKAAGIVIDDAAVTPRYVVGFAAERELPIIGKIAWGSIKNKLLILLPGALALSFFAPWAITPLLMAGGLFLCFEGYEKLHAVFVPHADEPGKHAAETGSGDDKASEDAKVASAIRTDMILSAEIMAITLSQITTPTFWNKAAVLAAVGIAVTVVVYGAVALIVKADDLGVHLAKSRAGVLRLFGRGLVNGMPPFLKLLSIIGMLAMLWVGGGIILHGLAEMGWKAPEYGLLAFAGRVGETVGFASGFIAWLIHASGGAITGVVLGWLVAAGLKLTSPLMPQRSKAQ
jgi:predicted DNA repair protein MutK